MSQAVTEPTADRLALLYRITQTFNSSLDLNEVLNRVIDEVIAATHAGRGFVMLLGDDGSMEFRAARGIDHRTIDDPEFQISRSVVQRVAQEGRPLLTSNAQNDAWLGGRASVMALGLRSILCVPLQHKGATRGVIYVDNTVQEGIFTERDLALLAAIASSAAVAIENARLFREVQDNVRNLRLLNEISTDLTSTLDLERVLRASLQRAQDAFNSAAASILMVEGDELVFRVALGGSAEQVKPFRVPLGQGIAGWVVQHAQGVVVNNPQHDPRYYKAVEAGTGFLAESLMAAPLIVNGRAFGVIEVINKPGGYSPGDLALLSTIAASASIALENARLYRIAVEQGRMERELQVAREVQSSLIPNATPTIPGWEFAARWQPARRVAGDFYDFVPIGDRLGLVIADVSDKGMPAALFMALSRSIVRASVSHVHSLAESIAQANRLICADAANGMFVTLFCAQVEPGSGEVRYVNAGHNPPLVCRAGSGECVKLGNSGMALGFFAGAEFAQHAVYLEPGDFVVLYTDGVTEALNTAEQEFGEERLRRLLLDHRDASAEDIASALGRAVAAFAGEAAPSDDVTFVIAKRL